MEELETLKLECLALRDKIPQKLSDDDSFLRGQEGFVFGHNDDVVLDFSCLFEDHRGYNGWDDDNLLPLGTPSDAPFFAEKTTGRFLLANMWMLRWVKKMTRFLWLRLAEALQLKWLFCA